MAPHSNTLHENFQVDYTITYRFADTGESRNSLSKTLSYEINSYR